LPKIMREALEAEGYVADTDVRTLDTADVRGLAFLGEPKDRVFRGELTLFALVAEHRFQPIHLEH